MGKAVQTPTRSGRLGVALGLIAACVLAGRTAAEDVSPPAILQWFETPYEVMIDRTPDLFMAGYGFVWTPPPGRADSGDQSAGYDVYDRFDLGTADQPTLYGTERGLKRVADLFDRVSVDLHIDAIINHNGFSDASTPDFIEAGGYPGFILQNPDGDPDPYGVPGTDGDFNSGFDFGTIRGRLSGLIDIDHGTDFRFIRHPVDPDDPRNIPAGVTPRFGRIANVPDPANRRFYPDRDLEPIMVFDPKTQEADIAIYPFNLDDPMAGDPVEENATGLLMRYMQWMVQEVGVDGFRIDAAKHFEGFTLDFLDRAVYRSNPRPHLDGSTRHVFSYSEVLDGNRDFLQGFVRQDIDPDEPGRVGGNRDVLDFAQFFALRDNLTSNGAANDWNNVVDAGMDVHDDGLHNGSQGVRFVNSHDDFGPAMSNVAHAYVLMHPGNAVVYFNGKQFGDGRDFPKDGRSDALGGVFGDAITELVNLRNTHGRGNYLERWREKENFAFEREKAALVLLSNRNDGGFDARTLQTAFAPGTPLVELTGNARDWNQLVGHGDIPELLTVNGDGTVDARFLRNDGADRGYLIYGLATPQSDQGVELTHVSMVLEGGEPDADDFANGRTRLTDLHVIEADAFDVQLRTEAVYLLGAVRDRDADGDNALLKIDGGLDLNGNGAVDFVTPGSVVYGFEQFTDVREPGYFAADGEGLYRQTIDATQLDEGRHFVTVRAFRHRDDGGPAVFSDFKKVVYIDRLPPDSRIESFESFDGNPAHRDLVVANPDHTADSVHVFLNLHAGLGDEQILGMLDGDNQASAYDVNSFKFGFFDVKHGHNALTVVTFEPTGNRSVKRFVRFSDGDGTGLGDANFDEALTAADVGAFEAALWSPHDGNPFFNPAADLNGDGWVDTFDLLDLPRTLADAGAAASVVTEAVAAQRRRANVNLEFGADAWDIDALYEAFGSDAWLTDLDRSGVTDQADVDLLVTGLLETYFGDANGDGAVDVIDLGRLGLHFGQSDRGWADGDFNGDDVVDVTDLGRLGLNFGNQNPGGGWANAPSASEAPSVAVPEPGALALLGLGGLALLARRR